MFPPRVYPTTLSFSRSPEIFYEPFASLSRASEVSTREGPYHAGPQDPDDGIQYDLSSRDPSKPVAGS